MFIKAAELPKSPYYPLSQIVPCLDADFLLQWRENCSPPPAKKNLSSPPQEAPSRGIKALDALYSLAETNNLICRKCPEYFSDF
jgi:hypothetical protein